MKEVLRVENLSKSYRLGQFDGRSLLSDLKNKFAGYSSRVIDGNDRTEEANSNIVWSLKDINFSVNQGEALGIIGRNGAGKSTLLKILSRITSPTTGEFKIRGRVASLLEVGTGFHPELSGRDNIFLNGAILGMGKKEIISNFDEIVDFAGVEKYIDTPVKRYSSGMYVRLAFAVAAHLRADILIVDEVLAVGDVEFQKKCLNKMQDVTGHGRTILFVSHNMGSIRSLCSSVLLIEKGKDTFQGDTLEGVKRYIGYNEKPKSQAAKWQPSDSEESGSEFCNILSVSCLDFSGEVKNDLDISKPFKIVIEYKVLQNDYKALFSLILFDESGNELFGSINNLEPEYFGKRLEMGDYVSTCTFPGNLLNNGSYSLSLVGMSASKTDSFTLEHILTLTMHDDGILKRGYDGNYGGVLRPNLDWKTTQEK
uniref:ABC transporter ATP-binding protein n=1 Tax=Algoriphagus sp. TaxID=1872435 RepID=UPI0040470E17